MRFAAWNYDTDMFVAEAGNIQWDELAEADHIETIRLALRRGAFDLARHISLEGASKFSGSKTLLRYQLVLSPPIVRVSHVPPNPSVRADHEWLARNRVTYLGRWVALKDGVLLADGQSLQDLAKLVPDKMGVLFTRVE